ncbi:transposase-like protein [Methylobacterium sp. PvR107]|nr:transposase-like protein [Methylobacterium sp. PvR107]
MARRKAPRIPDAILDQLLAGADPKTAFEADGLLDELKKALAERALNAEMDHHLAGEDAGNTRNGYGRKTVTTETGRIELAIPRDRQCKGRTNSRPPCRSKIRPLATCSSNEEGARSGPFFVRRRS